MFIIKEFKNQIFRLALKQLGFTLLEVVVSSLIIGLILTSFLVNYHYTNKRSELNIIKQKVASDIRLAQNYSLGSKMYDTSVPLGGWGVRFSKDSSSYIIFADSNGDYDYDAGEADEAKGAKVVALPRGITISAITGIVGNIVDIVFLPPDPITYINGLSNSTVEITLKESSGNSTATILVNFFGLIDVVN